MQNIRCSEFERQLEAAVEARRPVEGSLREHAAGCRHCRPIWEQHSLLEEALTAWKAESPEADLVEAVVAKLAYDNEQTLPSELATVTPAESSSDVVPASSKSNSQRSRWTAAAMLLTSAAAVVIAVVFIPRPEAKQPGDAVAKSVLDVSTGNGSTIDESQLQLAEAPELTSAVRDAGVAYLGLANGAAEAVTQGAALLSPTVADSKSTAAEEGLQPSWVERVRSEVTPLGRQFGGAIDFLMETFPTESTPTT